MASDHPRGGPPPSAGAVACSLSEVIDYREQRLSRERAEAFALHLDSCAHCRQALASADVILPAVRAQVRAPGTALLAEAPRAAARDPSRRFWLPLIGVLAVLLLVALFQLVLAVAPQLWRTPAHTAPSTGVSPTEAPRP